MKTTQHLAPVAPVALVALCALVALAAGCDPGFEKYSIVKDQRVLALSVDPPEVILAGFDAVIPEVVIDTLWADPASAAPRPWEIVACVKKQIFAAGQSEVRDGLGTCEDDVLAVPLASGMAAPGDAISARFRADLALLNRARQADVLKGFDGQVHITIELRMGAGDDPLRVFAQKRIHYALPIPEGRVANTNPALAALEADGVPIPDSAPLRVTPKQKLLILPRPADGSKEPYRVLTFSRTVRELTESLRYSFFATGGSFSEEQTGGAEVVQVGSQPKETHTDWTAPEEPGMVRMWFVIRDERGGTAWQERLIDVAPIQ